MRYTTGYHNPFLSFYTFSLCIHRQHSFLAYPWIIFHPGVSSQTASGLRPSQLALQRLSIPGQCNVICTLAEEVWAYSLSRLNIRFTTLHLSLANQFLFEGHTASELFLLLSCTCTDSLENLSEQLEVCLRYYWQIFTSKSCALRYVPKALKTFLRVKTVHSVFDISQPLTWLLE